MTRTGGPRPRTLLALALLLTAPLAGCLGSAGDLVPGSDRGATPEPLRVSAHGPSSVLVGDTARFHASAPGVPPGTAFWFWDFGDGVEHEGVDLRGVEHTFTEAGAYTVTLTVVDADGRRGVNDTRVGVDQVYSFEASVSDKDAVGSRAYAATFPARADLARVQLDVTLERPSPAFTVVEPTPPEVVIRVRAPSADGGGDGAVVLEQRMALEGETTRVTTEAPGSAFTHPGEATFEVEAVDGTTHFAVDLVTRYA